MNRLARFAGFGAGHEEGVDRDPVDAAVDVSEADAPPADGGEALREPIIAALRQVHDPEIPVNIYDLGLIYNIDIAPSGNVGIDMTLTAPACPEAGMMPVMVKDAVKTVAGVGEVVVELVWDPPWSPDTMSDEAKLQLGML
jgi:FeS assembly SUF system protein